MQKAVKFPILLYTSASDYPSLTTNRPDYPVLTWEFNQVTYSHALSISVLWLISKPTLNSHPVPDRDKASNHRIVQ